MDDYSSYLGGYGPVLPFVIAPDRAATPAENRTAAVLAEARTSRISPESRTVEVS